MKTIIIIIIALAGLAVWSITHDHKAYQKVNTFSEECLAQGGFVTSVKIGFTTHRYQCITSE